MIWVVVGDGDVLMVKFCGKFRYGVDGRGPKPPKYQKLWEDASRRMLFTFNSKMHYFLAVLSVTLHVVLR